MADIIIAALIGIGVFAIIRSSVRKVKNGGCPGGCAGCEGTCPQSRESAKTSQQK